MWVAVKETVNGDRRALRVVVENSVLERKRSNIKGGGCYLYRVVETRHGLVKAPDHDYPTERTLHLDELYDDHAAIDDNGNLGGA